MAQNGEEHKGKYASHFRIASFDVAASLIDGPRSLYVPTGTTTSHSILEQIYSLAKRHSVQRRSPYVNVE
jgi:hypothetical protein